MCAPSAIGHCKIRAQKSVVDYKREVARLANLAIAAMSVTIIVGFVGVST